MSHAQSEYVIGASSSSAVTCVLLLIASLIRPSKSLQTLTDYLTLDQKCVSSQSWVGILVISKV